MSGWFIDLAEETFFAVHRAFSADHDAHQDDVPFSAEDFDETLRAEFAAFAVVRGDEADVLLPLEAGINDDGGDACGTSFGDDLAQAAAVEWREDDTVDAAGDHVFHDGDLLASVVFFLWTLSRRSGRRVPRRLFRLQRESTSSIRGLYPSG